MSSSGPPQDAACPPEAGSAWLLLSTWQSLRRLWGKRGPAGRHRSLMPTPLVLRAGQSQVGAHQNLLQRGGHAVVPAPRRPAGLHGVLHAHRHVVSHGCQPRVPRGSEPPAGCSHPTGGAAPHMPTALGVPKGGGLSLSVLHPLGLLAVPVRADFPPQQPQPSLWGILGASLSLTPPLLLRFLGVLAASTTRWSPAGRCSLAPR